MIGPLLSIGFRLGIWLLLTSDHRPLNVLIGFAVAVALPRRRDRPLPAAELAAAVSEVLTALPVAFVEAIQLMTAGSLRSGLTQLPASGHRNDLVIFLEIFRITITPFTICLGTDAEGPYRVHTLTPERGR